MNYSQSCAISSLQKLLILRKNHKVLHIAHEELQDLIYKIIGCTKKEIVDNLTPTVRFNHETSKYQVLSFILNFLSDTIYGTVRFYLGDESINETIASRIMHISSKINLASKISDIRIHLKLSEVFKPYDTSVALLSDNDKSQTVEISSDQFQLTMQYDRNNTILLSLINNHGTTECIIDGMHEVLERVFNSPDRSCLSNLLNYQNSVSLLILQFLRNYIKFSNSFKYEFEHRFQIKNIPFEFGEKEDVFSLSFGRFPRSWELIAKNGSLVETPHRLSISKSEKLNKIVLFSDRESFPFIIDISKDNFTNEIPTEKLKFDMFLYFKKIYPNLELDASDS